MKARSLSFDITPTRPLDQGAGSRADAVSVSSPSSEPLEANLLALWPDGDDEPILLVTLDLLYAGIEIRHAVELAASPLPHHRVVVAASHTHRAPMTDTGKPRLGVADASYLDWLTTILADHVKLVLDEKGASASTLRIGTTQASHSINRRQLARWAVEGRRLRRNVLLAAPNRHGSVDETVVLAEIQDENSRPVAMFWNYACHPVAHPDALRYSSHYAHHVREALRAASTNQALPVLFFQGFSGDTRPRGSVRTTGWKNWIRRLVSGPRFHNMTPARYSMWVSSLAKKVASIELETSDVASTIVTHRLLRAGNEFAEGQSRTVSFQMIRFSDEFCMVGMSGEVMSEYAAFARQLMGAQYTMCVGCLDDVLGYIPTARMLREGGYEGGDFVHAFGLQSVSPEIEANTKRAFEQLLTHSE